MNKLQSMALSNKLVDFFANYQQAREGLQETSKDSKFEIESLAHWFAELEEPLILARRGAFSCDPWKAANLGKDEVRNSFVLAWLINPKESHGLGSCVLESILAQVNKKRGKGVLLESPGSFCRVCTEVSPNGDGSSRVDIEIDAEKFYLVIEVKIKAPEKNEQVERNRLDPPAKSL